MAAKSMTNSFNQQLGWLDNTLQPQTQDAWYKFLQQNSDTSNKISGLYSPDSVNKANSLFDQGLDNYDQNVASMYQNAGYSRDEQNGQKLATLGGIQGAYGDASNQIKLQQQRTGNSAGVNASLGKMGREKGQMESAGLGGLQAKFGDARIQGQQNAMSLSQFPAQARLQRMQTEQGTAGLGLSAAGQQQQAYGTGVQGQLGATGIRAANIANNPSFMKTLGAGLAGSLGNIGLAFDSGN